MDAVAEIGWNPVSTQSTRFSLSVENERTDAERDGRTRLVRANSQARTGQEKNCFPCSADHEQDYLMYCTVVGHELMDVPAMSRLVGTNVVVPRSFQGKGDTPQRVPPRSTKVRRGGTRGHSKRRR